MNEPNALPPSVKQESRPLGLLILSPTGATFRPVLTIVSDPKTGEVLGASIEFEDDAVVGHYCESGSAAGSAISPAELGLIAQGRDRQRASQVIAARLRLLSRNALYEPDHIGPQAILSIGPLRVRFRPLTFGATYFRIQRSGSDTILMTGHLDPQPPGLFDGGRLHPMTWQRGWEAELFRHQLP